MKIPKLIVYDFDGVMTDNRALLSEDGKEYVWINRGDGFGVRMIKDELQIHQIILSTEVNTVVAQRANKLKLPVIHGVEAKEVTLIKYCNENKIDIEDVMFIGNDLNDLGAMELCGYKACPSDAEPEIISIADMVFHSKGGAGVVRELYRILSQAKGEE